MKQIKLFRESWIVEGREVRVQDDIWEEGIEGREFVGEVFNLLMRRERGGRVESEKKGCCG